MYESELERIVDAARGAGRIILSAADGEKAKSVTEKEGSANFVTEYDKRTQEYLFENLGKIFPDAVFIGEEDEGEHRHVFESGLSFIIDPIDGTTNFIRDMKKSVISIGLLDCGVPTVGVVYDPYADTVYTAVKGEGAYRNGERMHTVKRSADKAIIFLGTAPYYKDTLCELTFDIAKSMLMTGADLRRSGSAVADFMSIACGSGDMSFEAKLSPWDYAASSLILTEAGGMICTFDGEELTFDKPCSVLACGSHELGETALGIIDNCRKSLGKHGKE